jgi:hypothetical protein
VRAGRGRAGDRAGQLRQPEVEQLIAAKPQVIYTETSPQTNATYLAELQQLGHPIPVIGTDVTI